jgi:hypothetical protein
MYKQKGLCLCRRRAKHSWDIVIETCSNAGNKVEGYIRYNEFIIHAFIQHVEQETTEHRIDKAVAIAYKDEPEKYYRLKQEEKEEQKKVIKEELLLLKL